MKRALSILLFTLAGWTLSSPAEVLVFKNGDRITGKITERNPVFIRFHFPRFGPMEVDTSEVKEILSTPENQNLSEQAKALTEKAPNPQAAPADLAQADRPKKEKKSISRWSGQAGLAIAMRDKNSTRVKNGVPRVSEDTYETYRLYGHVDWKGIRNSLNWKWIYRYSRDETRVRDDYFNLTQKYNHNFEESKYYMEAKTMYQRDYNRGIENEFLQTAELGKKWNIHQKISLKTSIGGGFHTYERLLPEGVNRVGEPKLVIDEAFRWQLIRSLALFQNYNHLGNFENYQFSFNAGVENKLIHDLFLRFEYQLRRDTETSYDDKAYYDKALLTSLLYKF
jgi:hypothetical protein